jgi:membrane fusion protein (multidrug efflux system)
MKPCVLFAFLALFPCFLCGCRSGAPDKKDPPKPVALPAVEGIVVQPSTLSEAVTVSGTLKPFEETVLMPEVSGRVALINIREGAAVAKGALLVKLFDDDLQAQLAKAQAQIEIAQQTEKRQAELLKISGVSQSDYDQAKLQVDAAKADIAVLKAQIRKTEVVAPFDGIVGLRNVSVGAEITPATPLVTIRAVNRLKLDFNVPERYGLKVIPGMQIRFSLQGDARDYSATLLATEKSIELSTRTLKVRALVDGATALLPGAFVTVELLLGENKNALMVPTQALIPQDRDTRLIVARQGKAQFIKVKTGVRRDADIEIIDGIAAGDTVATTGLQLIKPGMPLKFSNLR